MKPLRRKAERANDPFYHQGEYVMGYRFAAFALCLIAGGTAFGQDEGLTPASMDGWTIICAPDAIESEQYAAEEFQTLFREMTGLALPIAEFAPADGGAVYIGPDAVAESGRLDPLADPGKEDLRIHIEGEALFIDGGRPRGTLYGVYEFFEELCGVRFLTYDHTWYPENAAETALDFGEHVYEPVFAYRFSYYGETRQRPAFATRLRNNAVTQEARYGGSTGYRNVGHTMSRLIHPDEYGEDHPEYFALVDGERKLDAPWDLPQLCMTNPGVLELMIEKVREEIARNPHLRTISVGHMDNEEYCQCADCAAINEREESTAGATIAFVNEVAERIEEEHPDVLIGTYAYQYTRKPPKNINARSNVQIQLCSIEACNYHPIDDPDCPLNRAFAEDMAGWKDKADHIKVWHYNTSFRRGYLAPYPNFRSIGPSVAYYADNNAIGIFMQAAGNAMSAELSDLRNYVMSRCLWKPGRDSWEEMEEFCRLHYGEAAETIIEYLTWYHDLVGEAGTHPTCFPTESELQINPESARRIMAFFEEALALAESGEVYERVEKASISAYRAALSASSMQLVYEDGIAKSDLQGFHPELLDHFEALCERHGVTMEDELTPVGRYIDSLRALYAGFEAVELENDMWRAVVLPESNGKLVELVHKPSGRDIIEPHRAFDRFRFEEWTRAGAGPDANNIMVFDAEAEADRVRLSMGLDDGSELVRSIALEEEAVRFETNLTAGQRRPFDFWVHPEYDPATMDDDPEVLAVYVRDPDWTWINRDWDGSQPTAHQTRALRQAADGGAFAFYNHDAGFGVEQRFDPADYETLYLYWNPTRRQLNLELYPRARQLDAGEEAGYAWEVRYLDAPPEAR